MTSPVHPQFRPAAPDLTLVPAEPPAVSITPNGKRPREVAVPLTISLSASTIRKARLLASAKETSLSKLIAGLLDVVIKEQLADVLADITADDGGSR